MKRPEIIFGRRQFLYRRFWNLATGGGEHLKLLNEIEQVKYEKIFLVGTEFGQVAGDKGFELFSDVVQLSDHLRNNPVTGSLILIKGSRGMTLEKIYELL